MTDKQTVMTNYPSAFSLHWPKCAEREAEYVIYAKLPRGLAIIGRGDTEAGAWTDAINFGPDTSKR